MAHYTAEATLYVILGACVPPLMLVALRELKRWQIFSNEPALLLAARKSGSGGLDDERSAAIGPLPHETHVHFVIGDDQTSTEVVVDPSSSYEFLLDQLALVGMEAMRPAFPLSAAALRIEYGISDGAECAVWLAATSQTPMQSLLEARFGLLVTVTPPTASSGLLWLHQQSCPRRHACQQDTEDGINVDDKDAEEQDDEPEEEQLEVQSQAGRGGPQEGAA